MNAQEFKTFVSPALRSFLSKLYSPLITSLQLPVFLDAGECTISVTWEIDRDGLVIYDHVWLELIGTPIRLSWLAGKCDDDLWGELCEIIQPMHGVQNQEPEPEPEFDEIRDTDNAESVL